MAWVTEKSPPPWLWCILMLPYGIAGGFVSVTIAARAEAAGIDVESAGALAAIVLLPHTWKFLWSPLTDITLTKRRWYIGSNVLGAIGTALFAFIPVTADNLAVLELVAFIGAFTSTTLGMAVEALMAHTVPRDRLGLAAGWF